MRYRRRSHQPFHFLSFLVGLTALFAFAFPTYAEDGALPQEALVSLVKPSVVRIAEHVTGTAVIPAVKVDIRQGLMAVVPGKTTEVPVDEYLSGSGFIIHPDGYIATNAHVVSEETVKLSLASESALSALYENALFFSDADMQTFLQSGQADSFTRKVIRFVIDQSVFTLKHEVAVLRPDAKQQSIADLMTEGYPARVVAVNERFNEDDRDEAVLKIDQTGLPALRLGDSGALAVGAHVFIFGFPATAELNQNNPSEATFTQGVVSAIKQASTKDLNLFQTDAKVSEGSSGGPLFDDRGAVVGMVTFQTGQLSQASGDNFAFALPIEVLTGAAATANVPRAEGTYGTLFRQGFDEYSKRHCDAALSLFSRVKEAAPAPFLPQDLTTPYIKQCETLKRSGQSLDTGFDRLRGKVSALGNPFFSLVGAALFLFGVFGAAFFWLLRQVRREGREIESLEERLKADELRLRLYERGAASRLSDRPKRDERKVV